MSTLALFDGSTSRISLQFQTGDTDSIPSPAAAIDIPFQEAEFTANPVLSDNDTFNAGVLDYAQDKVDDAWTGTMTMPYCLNAIGYMLKMLFGAPVTTGDGPYTHVFTASLCPLPTALLEAKQEIPCTATADRMRVLGAALNQLSWDPLAQKATMACEFLGCRVVDPAPSTDFHSSPTRPPMLMAVTRQALIADVIGASTLGKIVAAQLTLNNRLQAEVVADGKAGAGGISRSNKPLFNGNVTALWETGTVYAHAMARVSKALNIVAKDSTGTYSMTTTLPKVKFTQAAKPLNVRGGLRTQHPFIAHYEDGDSAPTITLVNQIESY